MLLSWGLASVALARFQLERYVREEDLFLGSAGGAGGSFLEKVPIRPRAPASFFLGWNCSLPQLNRLEPVDLWNVVSVGFTWPALPALLLVGSPE